MSVLETMFHDSTCHAGLSKTLKHGGGYAPWEPTWDLVECLTCGRTYIEDTLIEYVSPASNQGDTHE